MPRPFARVLIADDEPIVRLDLRGMLEEHGFAVAGEAADGFDAVEGCRALAPDVALLDVRMPIFDGLEAAHTIVSETLAGCVVLLTAFGDREYIERAKEIGVAGYLVKPVDERQLAPTLEMAIASGARVRRAMDESAALRQKMNEHDTLERAVRMLARARSVSEADALRLIQKLSMDKRKPLTDIALALLRAHDPKAVIDRAKAVYMAAGLPEKAAYQKILARAKASGCSPLDAARAVLREAEDD